MKIIDTHCHVYPDSIAQLASSSISSFYQEPVRSDGSVSALLSESARAGDMHHILSSVATTPHQVSSINRFISETVRSNPDRFSGLGAIHPDTPDPAGDLRQVRDLGLLGIKIHPDFQKTSVTDKRFLRIFELCESERLPVLCHCGDNRYAFSNPEQILQVLKLFPNLVMIGAHFGGWTIWSGAVAELYDQKNLYVDTSSALFTLGRAEATAFIRFYGAGKVLFGVDYPMWVPSDEITRVKNLLLTEEEQKAVFFTNAARLFGLSLKED